MRDAFPSRIAGASAREAFVITPDDDVDLEARPQAIWVGGEGDLTVVFNPDSDPVEFKNIAAGYLLPIAPTRVLEATTATDLVGVI